MFLWSISGLEGTLDRAEGDVPAHGPRWRLVRRHLHVREQLLPQHDAEVRSRARRKDVPLPVFDYRGLSNALFEIANRRYTGKQRKADTYQIILMADGAIPYNTIASVMAAMRCKLPEFGKEPNGCALPTEDPELKKAKDPISPDKRLYDTTRATYDPKTMALFSDILFSSGFE